VSPKGDFNLSVLRLVIFSFTKNQPINGGIMTVLYGRMARDQGMKHAGRGVQMTK
jgi:hypothetical protein